MRLYSPVDLTGNVNMIEKLVLICMTGMYKGIVFRSKRELYRIPE